MGCMPAKCLKGHGIWLRYMNLALSLKRKMGRMGRMGVKFFEPPSSSFQGGRHISHQASLLPEERGCNRPSVLTFLKSSRPSLPLKKAPPLISVFSPQGRRGKPPSGARNRCAIRLAGHQSPAPCFAGWDRLGKWYLLKAEILIKNI